MNKKTFIFLMLCIGFVLITCGAALYNQFDEKCVSDLLRNAVNIILGLGIILVSMCVAMYIGGCNNNTEIDTKKYSILSVFIGILVAVCGSIILQESNKTHCDGVKGVLPYIFVTGIGLIVVNGGMLVIEAKTAVQKRAVGAVPGGLGMLG